ncbi:hypothetical protein SAMN05216517_114129 [Janthinobacterium sp. OK676]|uniref:hypothetical protein n=1 Tax=unclassified Janthinobacterium TaxID=2610881 RepID=UPI00088BFB79|nr:MULTISPECIES: hypothetical protein [unclassified Janthinobacterium]PJJ21769.1 hypothetical protein CLU90_5065 [Janthinobacterium sp. 67]SDN92247.1 hypothetical protein SAMN05216517_114129 [Janthinobacterium sp. OK676]
MNTMRYLIDPVTSAVCAFEREALAFIDKALAAGMVDCSRPPEENESWDRETAMWAVRPDQDGTLFQGKALAHLNATRILREQLLNRLCGLGYDALNEGDNDMVMAIHTARRALRDITEAPAVVAATDIDQLRNAVSAAYQVIVAAAPEQMQVAFLGIQL